MKEILIDICLFPFVAIGFVQFWRGFWAVIQQDEDKINFKKYWHFVVYLIINIASYAAFFYYLYNLILK